MCVKWEILARLRQTTLTTRFDFASQMAISNWYTTGKKYWDKLEVIYRKSIIDWRVLESMMVLAVHWEFKTMFTKMSKQCKSSYKKALTSVAVHLVPTLKYEKPQCQK